MSRRASRLCVWTLLCAAGSTEALRPSYSAARACAGRSACGTCSPVASVPRGASGGPPRRSALKAVDRQEGHVVTQTDLSDVDARERQGASGSRWAKVPGSWSPAPKLSGGDVKNPNAGGGTDEGGLGTQSFLDAEIGEGDGAATESERDGDVSAEALAGGYEAPVETARPNLKKKRLKKFFLKDFEDSSWTVGIQWRDRPYAIQTTKVALKADGSVVWLDKGKGSWRLRTRSRDLVFYRDFFLNWNGKRIFSAKLTENTCNIYLEGQVKGWAPFKSLEVMGNFQAVRRDIVIDENTPRPPWEAREPPGSQENPDKRTRKPKEVEAVVDLS